MDTMTYRTTWTLPLLLIGAACNADTPSPAVPLAGAGAPTTIAGTAAPAPGAGTGVGAAGTTGVPAAGTPGVTSPFPSGTAGTGTAQPVAGTGTSANPGPMQGAAGGGGMPANCRGFSFENLVYSPGGNVLPNTCEPFHPTTNNPYAVRCVDVWPWYKTKFPGDQFCILPPPPDKGLQYGVHPQGKKWFEQVSKGDMSGYENIPAAFLMEDGQEAQANYITAAANTQAKNYYRNYARMRGGSHHMIVATQTGGTQETWGPASTAGLFSGTNLPGAQRPDENTPKTLEKPAEDDGLYEVLPANPTISFNMHHFNVTGSQILKEAWTNVWFEEDARVRVHGILGLELLQTATLAVQPGQTLDLHYSWNITQPIRLVTVFGHRHAWTSNFTAWIDDGTKQEIVYQSFNWLDEPTYRYDSKSMNPVPAPEMRTDGASSGVRMLMPGTKLHFNCHIEYTNERAMKEKAPMPSEIGTLRFANEAFTAEMCILFGSTAAVQLPTPVADPSPLPPFATID
jgi:hypothetical protein